MSTFTVQATLSHPKRREHSVVLDFLVGSRATLAGEEWVTAADPVHRRLVPVASVLLLTA